MEEIEVKFLDIDVAAIEQKLKKLHATKVGDYFFRRYIFDYPDLRLNSDNSWIRLRDEGNRIALTFKKRLGTKSHDGTQSDSGMQEIEIEVDDFEKTRAFFHAIGFIDKFYEENRRTRWQKDGVYFDIDSWPGIPPYLEIEGPSWKAVDEAAEALGLNLDRKKIFSTMQVYKLYGIEEMDHSRITFDGLVKRDKKL